MRDFVVGRSLIALSRSEFCAKAREAFALVDEERAMAEDQLRRN